MADVDAALEEKNELWQRDASGRRYFYALAEKTRKELGQWRKGYYADTLKMFSYVIRNKLPSGDWPTFLVNEMSQRPDNWLDEKKIRLMRQLYFHPIKDDVEPLTARILGTSTRS